MVSILPVKATEQERQRPATASSCEVTACHDSLDAADRALLPIMPHPLALSLLYGLRKGLGAVGEGPRPPMPTIPLKTNG